ncbi:hypothetical protein GGI13_006281 [Coemansia sp. RSA 455]|nr:hypothetical protein GGI13_006281 [Coemansia sp. RSA 455]
MSPTVPSTAADPGAMLCIFRRSVSDKWTTLDAISCCVLIRPRAEHPLLPLLLPRRPELSAQPPSPLPSPNATTMCANGRSGHAVCACSPSDDNHHAVDTASVSSPMPPKSICESLYIVPEATVRSLVGADDIESEAQSRSRAGGVE